MCVAPVGCSVLAYKYIDIDMSEAAHGRAPAVATGIKRARPDLFVMTYQGDGDLAAIGTAEIVHAANRGENISRDFRQQRGLRHDGRADGPHHDAGQKTTTTPAGRDRAIEGPPIERLRNARHDGRPELHRPRDRSTSRPRSERRSRRSSRRSAGNRGQGVQPGRGASPCPTYWRLPPAEAMAAIESWMVKTFPLGVYKDKEAANAETAEA